MSFEQIASSKHFSVSDAIAEQIHQNAKRPKNAISQSANYQYYAKVLHGSDSAFPLPFLKGEGSGVGFGGSLEKEEGRLTRTNC